MANKRKSFILFTDNRKQVEMLSDEEAGRIFKALLAYVDEGKVIEKGSRLVKVVFEGYKAQIDRNAEKYEEIRQKRTKASREYWAKRNSERNADKNQMNSNDTKRNQMNSNDTYSVSDSVSVSDSGLPKGNINNISEKNNKKTRARKTSEIIKEYKVPNEEERKVLYGLMNAFNTAVRENGSNIATVRMCSPARVEALRLLLMDYSQQQIARGFGNAARSPYLNGKTKDRRRPADFDWIVDYDNFTKIFEGGV